MFYNISVQPNYKYFMRMEVFSIFFQKLQKKSAAQTYKSY
jgi:hypothetical protein